MSASLRSTVYVAGVLLTCAISEAFGMTKTPAGAAESAGPPGGAWRHVNRQFRATPGPAFDAPVEDSGRLAERRVGNHGAAVLGAPGQHGMLNRALLKVIENLIAGRMAGTGDRGNLVQVRRRQNCSRPTTGSCPGAPASRTRRWFLPAERCRANAADSSRAGRCADAPVISRRRRGCHFSRHDWAALWRPGTPRRAGPRWLCR